jgi:hypothetical protein
VEVSMRKIKSWSLTKKIVISIIVFFLTILVSLGIEFALNMQVKAIPMRPSEDYDVGGSDRLLYYLDKSNKGEDLPEGIILSNAFIDQELSNVYQYVNGRYDTADFRVNNLIRLYYGFQDHLSDSTLDDIQNVLISFKYWMDQGGIDSMCYWSENHQILFATQEYLAGQAFPDEIFSVDGKTGRMHQEMAKERINIWMRQRFLYGFTEWYSTNYYHFVLAPMANFIQYADDPIMINKMKMIMDLMWFDLATQSFKYEGFDLESGLPRIFYIQNTSMGRAYSDNRASDETGNRMRHFIDFVVQKNETKHFKDSWFTSMRGTFNVFKMMIEAIDEFGQPFYEIPQVILEIFDDPSPEKILKSSQSLDLTELRGEGLIGVSDDQIMMQWAIEAFSNPEIVDNTIKYMNKHNMFQNEFLVDFNLVNLWLLRWFGLLGPVSRMLKPVTDGVAIERANVYTYTTHEYQLSNAQDYHPGQYADQHAISSANLSQLVSVFTTQPAKIPRRSGTPTYWTGNGRQPYSVQEKNVNLSIYIPPTKPGFMEPMVIKDTTHVYFPFELFDEVDESNLNQGYIFGRVGNSYIGIKARYALNFVPFEVSNQEGNRDDMLVRGSTKQFLSEKYDLVQFGTGAHYFMIELSGASHETFSHFKTRILSNTISFDSDQLILTYQTKLAFDSTISILEAAYSKHFKINNQTIDMQYQRYENAYVLNGTVLRKPNEIIYTYNGHQLTLNFNQNRREIS